MTDLMPTKEPAKIMAGNTHIVKKYLADKLFYNWYIPAGTVLWQGPKYFQYNGENNIVLKTPLSKMENGIILNFSKEQSFIAPYSPDTGLVGSSTDYGTSDFKYSIKVPRPISDYFPLVSGLSVKQVDDSTIVLCSKNSGPSDWEESSLLGYSYDFNNVNGVENTYYEAYAILDSVTAY